MRRRVPVIERCCPGQILVGLDQPPVKQRPGVLLDVLGAAAAPGFPGPVDPVRAAEQQGQRRPRPGVRPLLDPVRAPGDLRQPPDVELPKLPVGQALQVVMELLPATLRQLRFEGQRRGSPRMCRTGTAGGSVVLAPGPAASSGRSPPQCPLVVLRGDRESLAEEDRASGTQSPQINTLPRMRR